MGEESLAQQVDHLVADGCAGVVRLDVAGSHGPADRLRAGRPRARAADDSGDPPRDGERLEDADRARRAVARRGRAAGSGRPGPHVAGRRPAAGRPGRDDRAPAQPPVRDRRLLRRGRRGRAGRLRAAGVGPPARRHRVLPAAHGRPPAEVRGGLGVLLLQPGLRRPGPGRRAGGGHSVPRPRRAAGVCAAPASGPRRTPGPTTCPATRRSAMSRSTARRAPTSSTSRCGAAATAARSRPSTTCTTSGRPCWAGASCPTRRCGTCCARARTPTRTAPPTGSASGSTPPTAASSCSARTPACRSPPCTYPQEQVTWTVLANTAGGAWPVHRAVAEHVRRLTHPDAGGS